LGVELGISGHRYLDREHLAGDEFPRRNRLRVFDMLAGIDQEAADLFRESAILGPTRDNPTCRIAKQDLDSLFTRETKFRRAIAAIRQGDVNWQLADFREFNRFRRELYREDETAQFRVLILRDLIRRAERMSETTEPAALFLGRRDSNAHK